MKEVEKKIVVSFDGETKQHTLKDKKNCGLLTKDVKIVSCASGGGGGGGGGAA